MAALLVEAGRGAAEGDAVGDGLADRHRRQGVMRGVNESLDVSFEHWSCELNARELRKWGSPHFDWKQVGRAVTDIFRSRAQRRNNGRSTFSRNLIAVANHAYPEAALVDPVADLELWEEWRQGLREFPYLGRYAPLGIFQQSGKTSSASSVGVLGEVLAGRFAESMIAPTVLVRVARRWPDFILLAGADDGNGRFAFVESKAIGPDAMPRNALCGGSRVPDAQFAELCDQVVRQLNADPFIEIWGAFTFVRTISPMQVDFTLVQFSATDDKKAETSRTNMPAPVLSGLAERCLGAALVQMNDDERADLLESPRRSPYRKEGEGRLVVEALDEFHSIVRSELHGVVAIGDEEIAPYLEQALSRLPRDYQLPGRRTREAREAGVVTAVLLAIGSVGGQQIFMANLPESDEQNLSTQWKSDWRGAAQAWDVQGGVELWRAGGAVFAIGDPNVLGTSVLPKYVDDGRQAAMSGH
jgi:hypothetical protein